ncbi:MAG: gliding motility-associated C-terminal domain-containing protein [Saprospiraceae bacterium]|nr:gliding motility-associated C-terminal domain-containing protein [Saprospiraceae bacterium]
MISFLICWCGLTLVGQEICDNGIDDDGNGLVDLNDPECICESVNIFPDITHYIPNPDFEIMDCCPSYYSQMECCDEWLQATTWANSDYMHTCGFVTPYVISAGLVPFPSGEGAVGEYLYNGYHEYVGVCLNNAFQAGQEYTMSFQIAATTVGVDCDPTNMGFPAFNVTLFGHSYCAMPLSTAECPSGVDPSWIELGYVSYTPVAAWMQVEIVFTPPVDINGIIIGGPCVLPNGYEGTPCRAYIVFDDFMLFGDVELAEIELIDLGLPCSSNYTLLADINHSGGTWQWYFNGIALAGQNDPEFMVANNNFQSGIYTVTYTISEGCAMDSIYVSIPTQDTTEVYAYTCPGSTVECAGESYSIPGIYEVTLVGPNGCDSIVTCIIEEFALPPTTLLNIDTCGPAEIEICNQYYSQSGLYEVHCSSWQGCDSVVLLELNLLLPEAVISEPGELDCDSLANIILDGSNSPINLSGQMAYLWTGPLEGITGSIDEEMATIQSAGKYCLTIIYDSSGLTCEDSMCVVVKTSQAGPEIPLLIGPALGCVGDTVSIIRKPGGMIPPSSYEWIIDSTINYTIQNDDTIRYVLQWADTVQFCTRAFNECGASDTTCWRVITLAPDTTFQLSQTCDPLDVITTELLFKNQYGCDSLVISYKSLAPSSESHFITQTCEPAQAGIDTLWLQNQYGCDSLVITTTSLLPSHTINQTFYTCDPAQTGLDTLFLTNQYGCDSTLYIERIYTGNYQETNQTLICGAGVNYADTLLVTTGPCDSLFITEYTYAPFDTTWLTAATCDPTQAGITIAVQPSSLGCDSTIVTMTSLLPTDSTLVSGGTCDPAEAMFNVTVLSNQYGCDSVVTTDIQYVGIDTLYVEKTTCEPSQVGTVVSILPGVDCDTVLVTETTYVPFKQSEETIILCGQTGILSDTLYLQNSAGCDSLAIRYYEYVSLTSQFTIQDETCAGDQDGRIEIMNISGGQAPFEYQLNAGGWQSSTVFNDLSPGQYTILIRDAAGCLDTLSGLVITPGATIAIDAGPDRIAAPGEVIDLTGQTTQSLAQVQWTASDPLSCPTCIQTSLGPLTTNQTVVVTGWTLDGCSDSDALEVIIKTRGNIFIPNSFTPNGDGINDVFSIYGNDQVVRVRNLAVYDRWGNALFSRADLKINDPSAGWDGTFREELMDPGVYVYVVEVELVDGQVRLYKGDVTLSR